MDSLKLKKFAILSLIFAVGLAAIIKVLYSISTLDAIKLLFF